MSSRRFDFSELPELIICEIFDYVCISDLFLFQRVSKLWLFTIKSVALGRRKSLALCNYPLRNVSNYHSIDAELSVQFGINENDVIGDRYINLMSNPQNISKVLSSLKFLKYLEIQQLTEHMLIAIDKSCPKLTHLAIHQTKCDNSDDNNSEDDSSEDDNSDDSIPLKKLEEIWSCLGNLPNAVTFFSAGINISNEELEFFLSNFPNLEHVKLIAYRDVGDAGNVVLFPAMFSNCSASLHTIDLGTRCVRVTKPDRSHSELLQRIKKFAALGDILEDKNKQYWFETLAYCTKLEEIKLKLFDFESDKLHGYLKYLFNEKSRVTILEIWTSYMSIDLLRRISSSKMKKLVIFAHHYEHNEYNRNIDRFMREVSRFNPNLEQFSIEAFGFSNASRERDFFITTGTFIETHLRNFRLRNIRPDFINYVERNDQLSFNEPKYSQLILKRPDLKIHYSDPSAELTIVNSDITFPQKRLTLCVKSLKENPHGVIKTCCSKVGKHLPAWK